MVERNLVGRFLGRIFKDKRGVNNVPSPTEIKQQLAEDAFYQNLVNHANGSEDDFITFTNGLANNTQSEQYYRDLYKTMNSCSRGWRFFFYKYDGRRNSRITSDKAGTVKNDFDYAIEETKKEMEDKRIRDEITRDEAKRYLVKREEEKRAEEEYRAAKPGEWPYTLDNIRYIEASGRMYGESSEQIRFSTRKLRAKLGLPPYMSPEEVQRALRDLKGPYQPPLHGSAAIRQRGYVNGPNPGGVDTDPSWHPGETASPNPFSTPIYEPGQNRPPGSLVFRDPNAPWNGGVRKKPFDPRNMK